MSIAPDGRHEKGRGVSPGLSHVCHGQARQAAASAAFQSS